jgi:hypothetical protein
MTQWVTIHPMPEKTRGPLPQVQEALNSFAEAPTNEQIEAKAWQLSRAYGPEVAEEFEKVAKEFSPRAVRVEFGPAEGVQPQKQPNIPSPAVQEALLSFKQAPNAAEIASKAQELELTAGPVVADEFRHRAGELSPKAKDTGLQFNTVPDPHPGGEPVTLEPGPYEDFGGPVTLEETKPAPRPARAGGGPAQPEKTEEQQRVDEAFERIRQKLEAKKRGPTQPAAPRMGQTVVSDPTSGPDYFLDAQATGPYEQPYTTGEPELLGGARKLVRILDGHDDDAKREYFRHPEQKLTPL